MPYTLVEDGPILQIRASITDRKELEELIAKLTKRLESEAQEQEKKND